MAPAVPPAKATSTTRPGWTWPVATRTARAAAQAVSASVVPISQRRRSCRSAITPPNGESRPRGMKAAAATRPVQPAWWVWA